MPPPMVASALAHLCAKADRHYTVTVSSEIEESVMRHWALSATAIGAAILISSSVSASPVQGPVSGIYVLDRGQSDDVHKAIDSAVAAFRAPTPTPNNPRTTAKNTEILPSRKRVA